jgi:hypothetical protein
MVNTWLARYARPDTFSGVAENRWLAGNSRRTLNRQRLAGSAGCFVVRVVEIDPAPLGMRYRARLILGKRQRHTHQSGLANQRQNNCTESQPA